MTSPSCGKDAHQCKIERFQRMLQGLKCQAVDGDAEAAYMLGKMYAHGIHVEEDTDLATRFWRMAAKRGHPAAQHDFAMHLLTSGHPTSDRVEEALYWLGTSASSGNAMSAIVLGRLYETGRYNVEPDLCMAANWYEAGEILGMDMPADHLDLIRQKGKAAC